MNGGNGPCSYARNSSYQRRAIETAEAFLRKEIPARVNLTNHSFPSFTIADFGCSSGPNTILAVDIIIQALNNKFSSSTPNTKTPAFQVFFNDLSHTDFNALFALLPPQRPYFVAGVPGSFYGNLFPEASLNLAYSSCALCWLSDLPPELSDTTSPAYNKGRIHYTGASPQVTQAYSVLDFRVLMGYSNKDSTFREIESIRKAQESTKEIRKSLDEIKSRIEEIYER